MPTVKKNWDKISFKYDKMKTLSNKKLKGIRYGIVSISVQGNMSQLWYMHTKE